MQRISFAIPCFNEEENVVPCYDALNAVIKKLPGYRFEFIFADNGSADHTRQRIVSLAHKDKRVKGIFLSRNFGPEASGQAVLDYAAGDAVIPYECDMQDPPEVIPMFIKKWEEGYDSVVGVRTKIEDNPFMTLVRTLYYRLFRAVSDIDVPVNAGSFSLLDKKVIDAIRAMPEKYRFFRGLRAWAGFKTAYVPYKRRKRTYGKSSYTFFGYIQHAQRSFFGFSYFLLSIIVYVGLLFTFFSFSFLIGYLAWHIVTVTPINPLVALLLAGIFLGGIQLLAISVVGKYVQVIVEETKNRPLYIVDQTINTPPLSFKSEIRT
ncbi:MAG: glycosyltransferase family 2 protein [Patescibacteria group bacterium]